ncbi:MAG: GNAT family N-acetyltransferase [Tannerellaceae bacterium]|nr:GNAT family N-acetyltransferase [Tannerellaceae bacterium]
MEKINVKQIGSGDDFLLNQIERTYLESFPEEERRPFFMVRDLIDKEECFKMYVVEKGNQYAGFISVWDFPDFAYVEHFAIDSAARSGGIGGKTLKLIKGILARPIVLEVELPADDLSRRRIAFYERMGFVLDDHIYIQPPYQGELPSLELRLMSSDGYDLISNFEKVRDTLYRKVYGVK